MEVSYTVNTTVVCEAYSRCLFRVSFLFIVNTWVEDFDTKKVINSVLVSFNGANTKMYLYSESAIVFVGQEQSHMLEYTVQPQHGLCQ